MYTLFWFRALWAWKYASEIFFHWPSKTIIYTTTNNHAAMWTMREWQSVKRLKCVHQMHMVPAERSELFTQSDGGSLMTGLARHSGCTLLPSSACIPSSRVQNSLGFIGSAWGLVHQHNIPEKWCETEMHSIPDLESIAELCMSYCKNRALCTVAQTGYTAVVCEGLAGASEEQCPKFERLWNVVQY